MTDLKQIEESLQPEVRPVLAWLVTGGKLPEREVIRRFEACGAEGFQQDVIAVAYESLPAAARRLAKRIFTVREEVGGRASVVCCHAHREHVEALEACGFLREGPSFGPFRTRVMPSSVREYIKPLAKLDPQMFRWSCSISDFYFSFDKD